MKDPQSPAQQKQLYDSAIDQARFAALIEYTPATIREKVRREVKYAVHLFTNERHFEVVQVLDGVIQQCCEAMKDVPTTVNGDIVVSRVRMITQGTAVPTLLSIRLFIRFVESSKMYSVSKTRGIACGQLLSGIEDAGSWKPIRVEADGEGTFYRYDKTSGNHYFKVIGTVNVNAIYVCGVIMELDLFSEWFPMCTYAQTQGDVSRFHRSSFFVVGAPWPVADREVFLEGYGIDDIEENGRIIIVAHSLDEGKDSLPQGIRAPAPTEGNVRCDVNYGGFKIELISPTTTRLSFIMSIDPKIPSVPQSVLNWVSARILWQMLKDIHKAAVRSSSKDSNYHTRRREKPEVYELFRTRYNDFLRTRFPGMYDTCELPADY